MKNRNQLPFVLLLTFCVISQSCKKNLLNLKDEVTKIDLEKSNIPNFSFVGYKQCEVPIPVIDNIYTIKINPGTQTDHTQLIQSKIDELSKRPIENGFRGLLILEQGSYFLNNPININYSGIVIKGESVNMGINPVIHYNKTYKWKNVKEAQDISIIKIEGLNAYDVKSNEYSLLTEDIEEPGSKKITIENNHQFVKGDSILVVKTTNNDWINSIGTGVFGWQSADYITQAKRKILDIFENKILLDIPIYEKILKKYGGGYIAKYRSFNYITNCAIENINFTTNYLSDEDESHVWSAIILENVSNCWIKNVKGENLAFSLVSVNNSSFNTIEDCSVKNFKSRIIGDRRYPFYLGNSSFGNLIQRCYSHSGRHDFSTGARLTGPNVFLDCLAEKSYAETGPHHRWAVGTLYDNVSAYKIAARNAGAFGSGHGWTGAFNMFWNNKASFGFLIQNPPDATNWLVGARGRLLEGSNSYISSHGRNVTPRSVFISQLVERIGISRSNKIFSNIQLEAEDDIWEKLHYSQ